MDGDYPMFLVLRSESPLIGHLKGIWRHGDPPVASLVP
jgi:hypothetical protein